MIALKTNQGSLYEQVADFLPRRKEALPVCHSLDKSHGRGEQRRVYLAQDNEHDEYNLISNKGTKTLIWNEPQFSKDGE